jgi:N-acetylglucosamine transport system permease protein
LVRPVGTKNWVGFDNYKYLWTFDDEFRRSLVHNGILVLTVPIITVAIALFLAYMLNVGGFRGAGGVRGVGGSKSYKVLYFFPYVLSVSIVAVLWQFIFNPSIGLVTALCVSSVLAAWPRRLACWATRTGP